MTTEIYSCPAWTWPGCSGKPTGGRGTGAPDEAALREADEEFAGRGRAWMTAR